MRDSYIEGLLLSLVVTSIVACGDTVGGPTGSAGATTGGSETGGSIATSAAVNGGTVTTGGVTAAGPASGVGGATSGGTVATSGVAADGTATGVGGATSAGATGGTVATSGVTGAAPTSSVGGATSVGGTVTTSGSAAGGAATGGTVTGGAGPDGYPIGNPPVPSAGCGQSPSLSSGTHQMQSAGLDREYILSVPDNYDSNTPHRLVFGMHWLNGSAEAVQGWSQWYGLKALDTENSTIFVAPQGYTDSSPWRRNDDNDHTYFDELLEALASDLCIDTSRVFSVGFSFGAMYTNSLAQNHQDVLRGVVVYATADYNIYFPDNTGEPLAYMGVHGLDDPTCPIDSGRASRDRFVENNGCTVPDSVPEATGGDYVTHDYDCPSNYPVRWITFDGGHTYPPNDTGTWVHGETWEFISQF